MGEAYGHKVIEDLGIVNTTTCFYQFVIDK